MGGKTVLYVLACTTAVSTAAAVYLLWERGAATTGGTTAAESSPLPEPMRNVRASTPQRLTHDDVSAEQRAESDLKSEELERQTKEILQPKAKETPQPNSLANAMNNPTLRNVIRTQQAATIEMLYRDFFARGQLSSAQIDQLKALLLDYQMEVVTKVAGMEPGPAPILNSGAVGDTTALDAQIAQLIGSSEYRALQSYRVTLPERLQVNNLSIQLTMAAVPLAEDQSTTLLNIMLDEKARLPPPARSTELTEEEFLLKRLAWADLFDKNVGERADQALTAGQLRVFRQFQQQQAALRANSRQLLASQRTKP